MTKVGSYKRWNRTKTEETILASGLECKIVGTGDLVVSQYPEAGSVILKEKGQIILYVGNATPETVSVPNLIGKNAETANTMLHALGLNISISGPMNGEVWTQSIAPGTVVPRGTAVEISFRSMDGDDEPNYLG